MFADWDARHQNVRCLGCDLEKWRYFQQYESAETKHIPKWEWKSLDWINWFVLDTQHTISLIIYTPVVFDYRLRAQLWSPPSRLCLPRVCLLVVGLSAELKQKLLKGFPKNLDEWWVSDQNRTHLVPILIKVLIQELSLTFQDLAFFFFTHFSYSVSLGIMQGS